jgi:hypothetical protein
MAVENLGGLVHTTSPGVLIREVIVSLVLGACDLGSPLSLAGAPYSPVSMSLVPLVSCSMSPVDMSLVLSARLSGIVCLLS